MSTENENAKEPKVIKLGTKKQNPVSENEVNSMEVNEAENVTTNEQPTPQVNPSEYGYKMKEKVPFEGNIVMSAMQFLYGIVKEETQTVHDIKDTFDATIEAARETITPKGLQALQLANLLGSNHAENVEDGFATHFTVLQKQMNGAKAVSNVGTPTVEKEG